MSSWPCGIFRLRDGVAGFGRAQQPQFSLKCVRLAYFCFCGLRRFYHIDPNRDALLRFNLMDRNGAICAVEHPFN